MNSITPAIAAATAAAAAAQKYVSSSEYHGMRGLGAMSPAELRVLAAGVHGSPVASGHAVQMQAFHPQASSLEHHQRLPLLAVMTGQPVDAA